jgi:flavin reductase (DIM6/NTAB) family NADH-FMN oxidoreductase RutF
MDNSKVQEDFLMAMRGVTSTVNVISAKLNEERHAMTATSVASLSLSPPAMIICVNKEASIHNILRKDKKFVINVLSNKQQNLSELCSSTEEGESRFKDGGWITEDEIVFNDNSVSNIICNCTGIVDYSTHSVFFGDVMEVKINNQERSLLYGSGGYIVD